MILKRKYNKKNYKMDNEESKNYNQQQPDDINLLQQEDNDVSDRLAHSANLRKPKVEVEEHGEVASFKAKAAINGRVSLGEIRDAQHI